MTFQARFRSSNETLKAIFDNTVPVHVVDNPYEGEYEATPKWMEQSFATVNKSMTRNFKVKEIPLERVSNLGGGYTAIIGG